MGINFNQNKAMNVNDQTQVNVKTARAQGKTTGKPQVERATSSRSSSNEAINGERTVVSIISYDIDKDGDTRFKACTELETCDCGNGNSWTSSFCYANSKPTNTNNKIETKFDPQTIQGQNNSVNVKLPNAKKV